MPRKNKGAKSFSPTTKLEVNKPIPASYSNTIFDRFNGVPKAFDDKNSPHLMLR